MMENIAINLMYGFGATVFFCLSIVTILSTVQWTKDVISTLKDGDK